MTASDVFFASLTILVVLVIVALAAGLVVRWRDSHRKGRCLGREGHHVEEIEQLRYDLARAIDLRKQAEAMHDLRIREREYFRRSLERRDAGEWLDLGVDTTVCRRAWGTRGRDEQLAQLAEECSELAAAANHLRRGKATVEQVSGEIADVLIQIGQLTIAEVGSDRVRSAVVGTQARIVAALDDLDASRRSAGC